MARARSRTSIPAPSATSSAKPAVSAKKVAITVRLDPAQAERLQAVAAADNRTVTDYVETALARDLAIRDEASKVIKMFVAPGVSDRIDPSEVVRGECESEEAYARRQALAIELWSIPRDL